MHRALLTLIALLMTNISSGQSLPPIPDGTAAQHTMVRAAGMPLNDGALPPGMLTVRVVRGAFAGDLAGEMVTVDVHGGKQEVARTGMDGRAQFAHLPVGAEVRVAARVGNQQLTSETFALPAESGVRILLVADDGVDGLPVTSEADSLPPLTTPAETTAAAVDPAATRLGPSAGVLAIRIFFTVATLAAFAFVLFRQSTPRRS